MFIPSYELAIYMRKDGVIEYNNPYFVFHFADKEIAETRMNWAKELIETEGMKSFIINLRNFDLKREGIYSGFTEYIERCGIF